METIPTRILTIIIAIVMILGVNIHQYQTINNLNTDIAKVKMETSNHITDEELDEVKYAIVDLNDRIDAFIEVHDSNVDIIDAMQDKIIEIIDYLTY